MSCALGKLSYNFWSKNYCAKKGENHDRDDDDDDDNDDDDDDDDDEWKWNQTTMMKIIGLII